MMPVEDKNILEFRSIIKEFPGVKALDNISMSFRHGEVHALCGENGAGKSTLMKILSGVYQPTSGELIYKGQPKIFKNPHQAQLDGISIIFQEFSLIRSFDVVDNVFINREPSNKLGHINRKEAQRLTEALLKELDIELDVNATVGNLTVVQQQVVEIVKALSVDANILIMDEPSAALTDKEVRKLFDIIRMLKAKGVTVVYISHMLEEIFEICDRVTVIKDGRYIDTKDTKDTDKDGLIRMMVGRDIEDYFPALPAKQQKAIMQVKNLSKAKNLTEINFEVFEGEVLGVAGMVGSGRTILAQCLLGLEEIDSGEIIINNQKQQINSISHAMDCGLGYLPADRKNLGILGPMTVKENMTIANLSGYLSSGFLKKKEEIKDAEAQIKLLNTKTPTIEHRIGNLSGGNQQKVIISRWLLKQPNIYIFSEPTRGIDVGAKAEIYKIIRDVANGGNAVVMISSELPEIIGMSDRIMVMNEGAIEGFIDQHTKPATEEEILSMAVGHEYVL
ncbi:MAG: sugar ABC transporter ATP-binding protein [bacterium]|nr:sugar ABC transporter ATP-binding protein [bacterium]